MKMDGLGMVYRGRGRDREEIRMAFGYFDETMIPKLRWLLQPFGLRLIIHSNSKEWGDQVSVKIEGGKSAKVLGKLGGRARAERMSAEERRENAKRAAQARWAKLKENQGQ